jgi:hypothetical protein
MSEHERSSGFARGARWFVAAQVLVLLWGSPAAGAEPRAKRKSLPDNLAQQARVTASSEYSQHYLAKFICDGKVPVAEGHDDLNQAWCVKGDAARSGELEFCWDEPVRIGEVIYYGRTAWFLSECFKNYELYVNDSPQPAAKGTFAMAHGAQRIAVTAERVSRLVIKFLDSYNGPNPGASEILIYSGSPSQQELVRIEKALSPFGSGSDLPWVDNPEPEKLRA